METLRLYLILSLSNKTLIPINLQYSTTKQFDSHNIVLMFEIHHGVEFIGFYIATGPISLKTIMSDLLGKQSSLSVTAHSICSQQTGFTESWK